MIGPHISIWLKFIDRTISLLGIARTRLTISISLYSAFLGSGANLIAVLAQTSHYEVALQLSLVSTFWFCIFGAVGALLIVPISIYHF